MSNPYGRNGHRSSDNCISSYCLDCGRASSLWTNTPCDHKSVSKDEFDAYGYRIRRTWTIPHPFTTEREHRLIDGIAVLNELGYFTAAHQAQSALNEQRRALAYRETQIGE